MALTVIKQPFALAYYNMHTKSCLYWKYIVIPFLCPFSDFLSQSSVWLHNKIGLYICGSMVLIILYIHSWGSPSHVILLRKILYIFDIGSGPKITAIVYGFQVISGVLSSALSVPHTCSIPMRCLPWMTPLPLHLPPHHHHCCHYSGHCSLTDKPYSSLALCNQHVLQHGLFSPVKPIVGFLVQDR